MLSEELIVEAAIGINFAGIKHPTAEDIRACHRAITNNVETEDIQKMVIYGHTMLALAVTVQDALHLGMPVSGRIKAILRWSSSARPSSTSEN
jgi:hypothetical protein